MPISFVIGTNSGNDANLILESWINSYIYLILLLIIKVYLPGTNRYYDFILQGLETINYESINTWLLIFIIRYKKILYLPGRQVLLETLVWLVMCGEQLRCGKNTGAVNFGRSDHNYSLKFQSKP